MMTISLGSAGTSPAGLNPAPNGAQPDTAQVAAQGAEAILPFASFPFADLLGELAQAVAQDSAPVASTEAARADDSENDSTSASDSDVASGADSGAGQQAPLMAAMTLAIPMLPAALAAANVMANVVTNTAAADGPKLERDVAAGAARTEPAAATGVAVAMPAVSAAAPDLVAAAAPRVAPPAPVAADGAAANAAPAPAASAGAARYAAAALADGGADPGPKADAPAAHDNAGINVLMPGTQPAAPQRGADTVALSGPPTAWRQSLRAALGERVQVQSGSGLDQAVIRLDPPQLGRVEIAIRHSAGSLEVTLSATNGEVRRQLQGVSDSLRNDLSQRQYLEVAVTVAPAPRSAAANPFSGDAQGRRHQPEQDQEQHAPGLALFDDNADAADFTLTGRA